jgi:ZIP family zinc transporter
MIESILENIYPTFTNFFTALALNKDFTNIESGDLFLAFLYTILAGLSTVIGGFIVLFTKKDNKKVLSVGLGFAAGVMIYISLVEILSQKSLKFFEESGVVSPDFYMLGFFVAGLFFSYILDMIIPHILHLHTNEDDKIKQTDEQKLLRSGVFTAMGIGLHNLPEGLITFIATLADPRFGFAVAVAVALHNIPEGLSVAMPIYHATGSKIKALSYTLLAAVAEPVGALIAYFLLLNFVQDLNFAFGAIFAIVSAIMIYISFDEILPTAYRYNKGHLSLYGVLSGIIVMALSLIIL